MTLSIEEKIYSIFFVFTSTGKNFSKAYFNCHTDITIPYDELGAITVVRADGTTTDIIRNGRFVPGTEPLNEPLDAMEP